MIPFVAKILESCADSSVFKPPNPWTMAIMSVLRELHAVQDLKVSMLQYLQNKGWLAEQLCECGSIANFLLRVDSI